jgi:hypothetical protein
MESDTLPLHLSPPGRGRREVPGEGVNSQLLSYALTPTLSPREREFAAFDDVLPPKYEPL